MSVVKKVLVILSVLMCGTSGAAGTASTTENVEEDTLIYVPQITYNVHSFALGYDITDSTTVKSKSVSMFAEAVTETSSRGIGGDKTSTGGNAGASLGVKGVVEWVGGFVGGNIKIDADVSWKARSYAQSERWSKNQVEKFVRNIERSMETTEEAQITNLHLTFSIDFKNNGKDVVIFHQKDTWIPVSIGNTTVPHFAEPIEKDEVSIPLSGIKTVIFRMDLKNTQARELLSTLRGLKVDVPKGKVTIKTQKDKEKDKDKLVYIVDEKCELVSIYLKVPGAGMYWDIRRRHKSDNKVATVREALDAIEQDMRRTLQTYGSLLAWSGKQLEKAFSFPFGKIDEKCRYIALWEADGKISDVVEADSELQKRSYSLWIFDLENVSKPQDYPEELKKIVYQKVKEKAERDSDARSQWLLGKMYQYGFSVKQDDEKAVEWFKKAAKRGHADAQNDLGKCYYNGKGTKKNDEEAEKLFQKAADQELADAQFNLGEYFYVGKNYQKAVEWFKKAAEPRPELKQGHVDAQFKLGYCFYHGKGVEKDFKKAEDWYKKAAEQNHLEAQYCLGWYYAHDNWEYEKAVEWYKKAAGNGYAKAQCQLAWCYFKGEGIDKNWAEAIKWWEKAAEQEYAEAQYVLGYCYYKGNGVVGNKAKAVILWKEAAENGNGHAEAQYKLACHYNENKDYAEAFKWFEKAAGNDHAEAQYKLARHYNESKDYTNGSKWYKKAAENGHTEAQYVLGKYFHNEKLYAEAFKWFEKAAKKGHADAQYFCGFYYFNGMGVEKSYSSAVEWYKKAADQGQACALNNLGECYEKGNGVDQNYEKAKEYYDWATKANPKHAEAWYNLGWLYYHIDGMRDIDKAEENYEKAADLGHEKAKEMLDLIEINRRITNIIL